MAFLKNEEYKETLKEDLSDSEENFFFESIDEVEKEKEKINLSDSSRNKITKVSENTLKENIVNRDIDTENVIKAEMNMYKNLKSQQEDKDDYFKEEDSKTEDQNVRYNSEKGNQSQADIENSNNTSEKEDSINEQLQKQTFSAFTKEKNAAVNDKKSMINQNKTRNIKSIEAKNSSKFRSTFGSSNSKLNKNHKRASSNFSVHQEINIPESKKTNSFIQVKGDQENNKKIELSSKSNITNRLSFINKIPLDKIQDFIKSKKKKLDDKILDEIKVRSEAKADQILEISLNDYSQIEPEDSDRLIGNNVNLANLHRVIRVRNILKGRHKDDEQKLQYEGISKESDDELNKVLRFKKLGPPSFLKTNFKRETETKFKMLGGKFFGCKV